MFSTKKLQKQKTHEKDDGIFNMFSSNPNAGRGLANKTDRVTHPSNMDPASTGRPFLNTTICLLAVFLVAFTGLCGRDLWTPDEPRVAAIVLEMANTNNFIIPHLAGVPFIEKPPLYFAAAALMVKLIGPLTGNTAAIRLTTAFFGLGVLLMTFLITRRLSDNSTGFLAMAVLATMQGFVEHFHWIVVDPALSFFVVACAWSLVEFYFKSGNFWLPLTGFFLAGAFLSKGTIGPALAFVPWAGLAAIWFFKNRKQEGQVKRFITGHLWLLVFFALVSGIWMVLLYIKGGKALWDEWFWVNQVGRFTGQAHKGHIKPGQPFFYVTQILGYAMPWTPVLIYWFATVTSRFIKKRAITRQEVFLLIWGAGSIMLLTMAATKRGLYLVPALPVYAIMMAVSLKQVTATWYKWYAGFWTTLCLIGMAAVFLLPLVPIPWPHTVPDAVKPVLVDFGLYHVIAGLCLAVCLVAVLRFRRIIPGEYRMVLVTTGLLVCLLGVPVQAIDRQKSMMADVQKFVSRIPEAQRFRIAGCDFSETMRGNFYYYTGWKVPQVDEQTVQRILAGQDKDYDSLLVKRRDKHGDLRPATDLAPVPYVIVSELVTGDHEDRKVFWIKGKNSDGTPG